MTGVRHFLGMLSVSRNELTGILRSAVEMKTALARDPTSQLAYLPGRTMAMVFEKPSLRTHTSFQTGMHQLGGDAIYLGPDQIGLGTREPIKDISRVLSRMTDIIIARVFSNRSVLELAHHSSVPVINALCDLEHPCQAVADMLTVLEHKGRLDTSLKIAFVGDGNNNVTHSLALACGLLGVNFSCASPAQHGMSTGIVRAAQEQATALGADIVQTADVAEAVRDADVVYTDTFVSMGQEAEKEERVREFLGFQVTGETMAMAKPDAIFMHDMPAYRGVEVTEEVMDGPQSVVIDQAENRLHAQKAIVCHLMGVGPTETSV